MAAPVTVTVTPDGTIVFVHHDDLAELLDLGDANLRRASHVEPDGPRDLPWTADMAPAGGPVLGPFRLRSEALAAEHVWLESKIAAGDVK